MFSSVGYDGLSKVAEVLASAHGSRLANAHAAHGSQLSSSHLAHGSSLASAHVAHGSQLASAHRSGLLLLGSTLGLAIVLDSVIATQERGSRGSGRGRGCSSSGRRGEERLQPASGPAAGSSQPHEGEDSRVHA